MEESMKEIVVNIMIVAMLVAGVAGFATTKTAVAAGTVKCGLCDYIPPGAEVGSPG
jgi:ActR/RegA family two-component response regulator